MNGVLEGERSEAKRGMISPFAFYGDGWTLFGIRIVNTLLTIITFGVYSFWGNHEFVILRSETIVQILTCF